jgi:beta-glucosidase
MNKYKLVGVLAVILGLLANAGNGMAQQQSLPFQNPNLPIAQRVDDLVSRMTLQEKVSQMMSGAPAIPRLGVPAYEWWSEGLHGLWNTPATVFPEPIGLAATFDLSLEKQFADAVSDEGRGWYNLANTGVIDHFHAHGLTYFAPNINIFRDPRWGRGQETYGEDPFLTANFGVVYVREMLGTDPKYIKLIATPKHFAVHSGPENERHHFDARPSLYDLNDTYLPAFEACVRDGHAQSVMSAYSALYGIPDSVSPLLIQEKLRKEWGFGGYVISDYGAVFDIYQGGSGNGHYYAHSMAEAAADAVKNGCDLTFYHEYDALPEAVKEGLITEAQIDVSVKRLFTARMKLGMFDPPAMVPFSKISPSVIDSPAHRQIALQAARESIVLLKNENQLLPLNYPNQNWAGLPGKMISSLAIIGPNADNNDTQGGNYPGRSSKSVSLLEALESRAAAAGVRLEYVKGCDLTSGEQDAATTIPGSALNSGGQPGLKGEYFTNTELAGAAVSTNQDATVDFNWTDTPPAGLPHDYYSVRWTGTLTAPVDGNYILAVRGDDGFRLFVNDQKVIDDWTPHPADVKYCAVTLKAGQPVPIRLEYFQATGDAEVSLLWRLPTHEPFADAVAAAKRADAVIFVGGISSQIEGEEGTPGGGDRQTLDLPPIQDQLLKALAATGKPVIFVLMSGSAMSINWAQENVPAIIEAWYSGEEGGTAIANVLFGDYNPAGRLPVTFYKGLDQLPDFHDYSMTNRTYRYFSGEPLYPFGYGLSYTKFAYSNLKAPATVKPGEPVTVKVKIENIGERAGDEVVQLYLRPAPNETVRQISPGQPMPRLVLAGFQRTNLAAHASKTVKFTLKPEQLLLVNAQGERTLQPGDWQIFVGGGQPNLSGEPYAGNGLSSEIKVR